MTTDTTQDATTGVSAGRPVTTTVDEDRLNDLLGRFVNDLGATVHAGNVVIGDRLGLYRGLSEIGPTDAAGLAARVGVDARSTREWLLGQAAGGYVETDGEVRLFWLSGRIR
jgi:hypothetical protein